MFFKKKKKIEVLTKNCEYWKNCFEQVKGYNEEMGNKLTDMLDTFPLQLNTTVYQLVLKDAKGKFTKRNPCKENSSIVEVEVTKKNYFKLVEQFNNLQVFVDKQHAENELEELTERTEG